MLKMLKQTGCKTVKKLSPTDTEITKLQKRIEELTLENTELNRKLKFKNNEQDESVEYFKLLAEENQRIAEGADEETKLMRRQYDRQLANLKSQLDQMQTNFETNTKSLREENELLKQKLQAFDEFFAEKAKFDAEREKMNEEIRNKNEEVEEAKLEAFKEAILHRKTIHQEIYNRMETFIKKYEESVKREIPIRLKQFCLENEELRIKLDQMNDENQRLKESKSRVAKKLKESKLRTEIYDEMIALVKRRKDHQQSQLPGFQAKFADLEKKLAENDKKLVPVNSIAINFLLKYARTRPD